MTAAARRIDPAELSKLLFEAREYVEMLTDMVEARTGRPDAFGLGLLARIDAFRAAQGWPADGFGGES